MTMPDDVDIHYFRKPEHAIHEVFLKRWSPRAMSGDAIADEELLQLFEAAKWAPSAMNEQPWRFIYAKKNTVYWDTFFNLLAEGNKTWCKNAAVLVVIVSKLKYSARDSEKRTHSFSAGSAFQNLALQGSVMNVVVHGMGGFDEDKAQAELEIPEDYFVNTMVAIGKPGSIEELDEKTRAREFPSDRKQLKDIVYEGAFKK